MDVDLPIRPGRSFFDLSGELRNEIYKYLLLERPSQVLHIRNQCPDLYRNRVHKKPYRRQSHKIPARPQCPGAFDTVAEEETTYELVAPPSSKPPSTPSSILAGFFSPSPPTATPTPSLGPSILGTCRQIYAEAAPYLYSNEFDFGDDLDSVVPFLSALSPRARKAIRCIHLTKRRHFLVDGYYRADEDDPRWARVCGYVARELPGLAALHLSVCSGHVGSEAEALAMVPAAPGQQAAFDKHEIRRLCAQVRGLKWIEQVCAIRNLESLTVQTVWEERRPFMVSDAWNFFVGFSLSIEKGLAELLWENMGVGKAQKK